MSEAPEPTFLEKLRKAREAAYASNSNERVVGNIRLTELLLDNSEKLAALIEAADETVNSALIPVKLKAALAALNEGA